MYTHAREIKSKHFMLKYSDLNKKTCTDIFSRTMVYVNKGNLLPTSFCCVCMFVMNCHARSLFITLKKPRKAFHSEFILKLPCFQISLTLSPHNTIKSIQYHDGRICMLIIKTIMPTSLWCVCILCVMNCQARDLFITLKTEQFKATESFPLWI